MPRYDYRCEDCNETFDTIQSIANRKTATHECGGTGNQVILSTPGMWCDPMDSGFPDAYNAWGDRHEKGKR